MKAFITLTWFFSVAVIVTGIGYVIFDKPVTCGFANFVVASCFIFVATTREVFKNVP